MVKLVLWCLLLAGLFVVPAASQTGGIDCDGDGVRESVAYLNTESGIARCAGHIAWGIHFFHFLIVAGFGGSVLAVRLLVRSLRGRCGVALL